MATQRSKEPRRIGRITIKVYADRANAEADINEMQRKGWRILDTKIVNDASGKTQYEFILFQEYEE